MDRVGGGHGPRESQKPHAPEEKAREAHPITGKMKESVPSDAGTGMNFLLKKHITIGPPNAAAVRTTNLLVKSSGESSGIKVGEIKTEEAARKLAIAFGDNCFNQEIPVTLRVQLLLPVATDDGIRIDAIALDSLEALASVRLGILHDPSTGNVACSKSLFNKHGPLLFHMLEKSCLTNEIPLKPIQFNLIDDETGLVTFLTVLAHEIENHLLDLASLQRIEKEKPQKEPQKPTSSTPVSHPPTKTLSGSKRKTPEEPLHAEGASPKRQSTLITKLEEAAHRRESKALEVSEEIHAREGSIKRKEDKKAEIRLDHDHEIPK